MKSRKEVRHDRLADVVVELQKDILERLQPAVVHSELPAVRVRRMTRGSMHDVAAVEMEKNGSSVRFFAKTDMLNYKGPQRLESEEYILRQVAPPIWESNARTRCPQLLAFFPDHKLLLLEMVEGKSLKELLFDVGAPRVDVAEFLKLTGEWLGRFHATTEKHQGNPFDWLETAFSEEKVRNAFQASGVAPLYPQLVALLEQFRQDYRDFRRPQCQLHSEFTPLHVLVKGDAIYVIDFGSTHPGYGYEDVAMFLTFFDGLLPWRALAGSRRLPLAQQKSAFYDAYLAHCGQNFAQPDEIVMAFARLWAL